MNTPREQHPLLDRYLDGVLAETERSSFEARLAADPDLRQAVAAQQQIDLSLQRLFDPDAAGAPAASVPSNGAVPHAVAPSPRPSLSRWYAAAALLIIGIALAALLILQSPDPQPDYPEQSYRTPEMVYRIEVQKGFTPQWVCKTDQEFASTYYKALGQALVVRDLPENVQALGLSYTNTFSPQTVFLLARAQGRPVIVLADRLDNETPFTLSPESGLHQHRRQIGNLILYEISPLPKPVALPSFHPIDMPEEWR